MLEEPACIAVVPVGASCRKRAERGADLGVAHEGVDDLRQTRVRDLRGEELEEAVELVRVTPKRGGQRSRIGGLRSLDGPHLHLQPPSEPFDAAEHVHRVALLEAPVEEIDVVPHARLDTAARVGELESEVGGTRAGALALLLRDGEDALDRPVLGELRDRGHAPSL